MHPAAYDFETHEACRPFTGVKNRLTEACTAAHELCFRLDDDIAILRDGPSIMQPVRYWCEPRHVGARPLELGGPARPSADPTCIGAVVVGIVRPGRVGSIGGIELILPWRTEHRCSWCEGPGFIVTLGGRRPCGRCGGTGNLGHPAIP